MNPIFWLRIKIEERRISLPLPIILPLAFVLEMLAMLPMIVYATRKKEPILFKLACGFYLSRLILALIIHGRGFLISVVENGKKVQIAGGRKC